MLGFLFGLLIVVVLILLAIAYRPVRWILAGLALLLALGIVGFLASEQQQKQKREAAKHLVSPQQLQFEEMRLGGGDLVGRVRNASRYTVTSMELELTLRDCVDGKCDIVGQTTATLYLDIPPGQVRGVDQTVFFTNVPAPRGTRQWDYRIISVSAQQ